MASTLPLLLFSPLFLFLFSFSDARSSPSPASLFLPIRKDGGTLQYLTRIDQRTPLTPVELVVDLGGSLLWVDCDSGYVSSTYRPVRCRSVQCSAAKATRCGGCPSSSRPGCNNNTCGLFPENTVSRTATGGELAEDVVAVPSTDGSKLGPVATTNRFLFSCAPTFLRWRLAGGAKGMVGLGRNRIGFLSQLAAAFNLHRKFSVCLPSSSSSNGVMFFGGGPYMSLPNMDVFKSLMYTPLLVNPVSTAAFSAPGDLSDDYFIGVKSIKINGEKVALNPSLLLIDGRGVGGTKISTVVPYTTMETSIYSAFTEAFSKVATTAFNMSKVEAIPPFGECFSSNNVGSTRAGPAVPAIDLVLQSEMVKWRILGANSMVKVGDDVLCLGFLDGGSNPRTSIVIGGHQLENHLLQFDLAGSRLGFSSSLLIGARTCSNFFNFHQISRGSS